MTDISPLAASARARFGDAGVHAIVRAGRTVHAVSLGAWVEDEEVPELLCRTGIAGWSPTVLQPTRAEVHLREVPASSRRALHVPATPAVR
ncbi:hypothetical protein ACFXPR_36235 [Nocardia tengchongensis]|uniref:hypothetical protein n=1 Tax=Nocardia tengchongensis TaxID=2055889 RepID=UPI0036853096